MADSAIGWFYQAGNDIEAPICILAVAEGASAADSYGMGRVFSFFNTTVAVSHITTASLIPRQMDGYLEPKIPSMPFAVKPFVSGRNLATSAAASNVQAAKRKKKTLPELYVPELSNTGVSRATAYCIIHCTAVVIDIDSSFSRGW
ncbi:hypothetical protein V501_10522 [Pseudogymnoascus sp. VKM F-4519 (FW-2642)]|nr:hypothetical protein V501_10522 [Pseudogymnoascus sp. VKM F-4519 (FW-2642)]